MLATRDVGELAAQTLLRPPTAGAVVALTGPACSERQAADKFAALRGRPLGIVTASEPAWANAPPRRPCGLLFGVLAAKTSPRRVADGVRPDSRWRMRGA